MRYSKMKSIIIFTWATGLIFSLFEISNATGSIWMDRELSAKAFIHCLQNLTARKWCGWLTTSYLWPSVTGPKDLPHSLRVCLKKAAGLLLHIFDRNKTNNKICLLTVFQPIGSPANNLLTRYVKRTWNKNHCVLQALWLFGKKPGMVKTKEGRSLFLLHRLSDGLFNSQWIQPNSFSQRVQENRTLSKMPRNRYYSKSFQRIRSSLAYQT